MENFRSMSCREGRMQMEDHNDNYSYGGGRLGGGGPPTSMQDLRSYSTSYATSNTNNNNMQIHPQPSSKDSKGGNNSNSHKKNRGLGGTGYGSSSGKSWSLSDPELRRKKRVASYKVYGVEGKMKGSFRKSFRWVKHTCSQVVHALW